MSLQTPQSLLSGDAAAPVGSTVLPEAATGHGYLLDDPSEWPSFGKPVGPNTDVVSQDPAQVSVWDSQLALGGMYCATCALTIEDALRSLPGVQTVEVSAAARRARVVWDSAQVRPSQLLHAVQRAGYTALPARDAQSREVNQALQRKALWRWLLATFCMMQVMMYAWPAYDAQGGGLSLEMEQLLRWASWVICIPMMIFACGPFLSGAWRDICHRRVSMDLPVALGMVLTFIISSLGTFDPDGMFGKEVFYDSLTMFVCFLLTGRWLEMRLRERTAGALDAVMNRLPDSVERCQADGSWERVALRKLAVGDVVRVLPGEAFPADGVITQGRTQADEALLTGESLPVTRAQGDTVTAGSYNLSAPVQMRVEQVGERTKFSQIVELMESAATQKPRLAQLADRVAGPFLVAVLVMAAGAAVYWWSTDPGHALMVAAAVLIVTCPCALSLATPVAMLTAAGTLARHGVLVRNLQALETLAGVQAVVFDKTGTLTRDGMTVASVQRLAGLPALDVAGLAGALALHSKHPVSQAVAAFDALHHAHWQVLELEEISGQGLRAQVQHIPTGVRYGVRLGSAHFTHAQGLAAAQQAVYLALEQGDAAAPLPVAALALQEYIRPEAQGVVAALQQRGLHVALLSGDGPLAVQRVAQSVGLEQAQAECTPQAKLSAMHALQAQGRTVAMVGDGLNDGPVLAGANVSMAFGRSVPLAQGHSDLVVLGDDLRLVLHAVALSRKTVRIVRQNLFWAAAYNAVSVPFALAGLMPAWLAGLGMALSSLLVVLNAARLAQPLAGMPRVAVLPEGASGSASRTSEASTPTAVSAA